MSLLYYSFINEGGFAGHMRAQDRRRLNMERSPQLKPVWKKYVMFKLLIYLKLKIGLTFE